MSSTNGSSKQMRKKKRANGTTPTKFKTKQDNNFQAVSIEIQAHIMSFLSSLDYITVPLVSHSLRNIFKNNPYIFNQKLYHVDIYFDGRYNDKDINNTHIEFQHQNKDPRVLIIPPDPERKYGLNISELQQFNQLIFSAKQVKYVKLNSMRAARDILGTVGPNILNHPHNHRILQYFAKNENQIERLDIIYGADLFLNAVKAATFNKCYILSIGISTVTMKPNLFNNIQCLEMKFFPHGNSDKLSLLESNANHILELLSKTLKCIRIKCGFYLNNVKIKIPSNIEWISIESYNKTGPIIFDLSECKQLIGMRIMRLTQDMIIWPNDNYVIPFVCFIEHINHRYWTQKLMETCLNIKFCVYLTFDLDLMTMCNFSAYGNGDYVCNGQDIHHDVNVVSLDEELKKKKNDRKCLVLGPENINDELVQKILSYHVQNEQERLEMMYRYQKWWKLHAALWMKGCAKIRYL